MRKTSKETVLWRETQRAWHSAWWRVLGIGLSAGVAAPAIWRIFQHLFWGVRWGGNRMSDPEFLLTSAFALALSAAVVAMVYSLKMTTEVCSDCIRVSFFPPRFILRTIKASEILKAKARIYRPILEYGGWGIRWGFGGRALTMYGRGGVQLTLSGGKRILIGSQRPEALRAALAKVIGRRKN